MSKKLAAVILAAGQGTRMKSQLPKVLHPVAGRPMLSHVVKTAGSLGATPIVPVIGHGAAQVKQALAEEPLTFAFRKNSWERGTPYSARKTLCKALQETCSCSVAMCHCCVKPPCGSFCSIIKKPLPV